MKNNKEEIKLAAALLQKAAGILEEISEDEIESLINKNSNAHATDREISKVHFAGDLRRYEEKILRLSESLAAINPPAP